MVAPDRAPPNYSPLGLSKNEGQPFPGSRPMCLQLVALLLPARVWVDRGQDHPRCILEEANEPISARVAHADKC